MTDHRVAAILSDLLNGSRLSAEDALYLFRHGDIYDLGSAADRIRERLHGRRTYWRKDININHTNICVEHCGFCSFRRDRADPDAYLFTPEQIVSKVEKVKGSGINEVHIVGGLAGECNLDYFERVFEGIKKVDRSLFIQALTAVEIDYIYKISRTTLKDALSALKSSGLDMMPGGGSEIFDPGTRKEMMAMKIGRKAWLDVHRAAHETGLPTNATMLYGHVETAESVVDHMLHIRDLQNETGGFLAFVPLAYNTSNNVLSRRYSLQGPGGLYDLRIASMARLFFDNIAHIKVPWVTVSSEVAAVLQSFGVDDLGGASYEERILDAAGGNTWKEVSDSDDLLYHIERSSYEPLFTNSGYEGAGR